VTEKKGQLSLSQGKLEKGNDVADDNDDDAGESVCHKTE
jgi:hypothetical protein